MDQLTSKSKLNYNAEFNLVISRWSIFRPLLMFVEIWVLYVWMIWIAIISFLHFWYMLIMGKRHQGLWTRQHRFMRHLAKWQAYLTKLIDERPQWIES